MKKLRVADLDNERTVYHRPWCFMHLSSALVLMLVAALLVFANVPSRQSRLKNFPHKGQAPYDAVVERYGWPISGEIEANGEIVVRIYSANAVMAGNIWILVIPNFFVAISVLATTAMVCESFTRRRQRRKAWSAQAVPE